MTAISTPSPAMSSQRPAEPATRATPAASQNTSTATAAMNAYQNTNSSMSGAEDRRNGE
jgi:hypothetical protein